MFDITSRCVQKTEGLLKQALNSPNFREGARYLSAVMNAAIGHYTEAFHNFSELYMCNLNAVPIPYKFPSCFGLIHYTF